MGFTHVVTLQEDRMTAEGVTTPALERSVGRAVLEACGLHPQPSEPGSDQEVDGKRVACHIDAHAYEDFHVLVWSQGRLISVCEASQDLLEEVSCYVGGFLRSRQTC